MDDLPRTHDSLCGRVVLATQADEEALRELRFSSFSRAANFGFRDPEALRQHCGWTDRDRNGTVLLALTSTGEAVATVRGNVRHDWESLVRENESFVDLPAGIVQFPTLDVTLAATAPAFAGSGLHSVLRCYLYERFVEQVASIAGVVVEGSSMQLMLSRLGYEFAPIADKWSDITTTGAWLAGAIAGERIRAATRSLRARHSALMTRFPSATEAQASARAAGD